MSDQETSQTPAPAKASPNRGRLFLMFGGAVVAIALVWGGYELLFGGKTVSTDNAYVDASSATITAQIAAPVAQVDIYDTKPVKKGDVLLTLDDTDARLALASAQAQLDQVSRQVSTIYENDATYAAQGFILHRHDRITGWSTLTFIRR